MSVNWNWKNKIGEITLKQKGNDGKINTFKINMYGANCLCALIYEYQKVNEETHKKENWYDFYGYWLDTTHLKRCLGLVKHRDGTKDNIYKTDYEWFSKVKLNTYYFDKYTKNERLTMVKAFTQSGIKVELYYKEPKESKSHSTKKGN